MIPVIGEAAVFVRLLLMCSSPEIHSPDTSFRISEIYLKKAIGLVEDLDLKSQSSQNVFKYQKALIYVGSIGSI